MKHFSGRRFANLVTRAVAWPSAMNDGRPRSRATRVIHIAQAKLYGGVESFLVTLAGSQPLCPAMESEFALSHTGRCAQELGVAGGKVHVLGPARVRYPLSVVRVRRRLAEILRRGAFDAAVCHSPWAEALFGPVVRRANLPLLFWLHGAANGRHWLERWASLTPPDMVLCNSLFTGSTLARLYPGVPSETLMYPVAPPAVSTTRAERECLRAQLDTPSDSVVIVQVSRMEAWKGHTLHLEALSRIRDVPGWTCWIVGGAQRPDEVSYLRTLRETARSLGVAPRVRFLGQRSDVRGLLDASDVFCQPNAAPEPFGIVFVEALGAGLPVVSTATGGASEIVTGQCGILVRPGDADGLADTLRTLIGDRSLRRRLGAAGPGRAAALCDPARQLARLCQTITTVAQDAGVSKFGARVPAV